MNDDLCKDKGVDVDVIKAEEVVWKQAKSANASNRGHMVGAES